MDIKHLIFDLDDTLYSSACQMSRQISENMVKMTADFFNVDFEQASQMRRENLPKHSSTLAWLMSCGFKDSEKFFAAVHPESETEWLLPAPNLRSLLLSFNIPMSVLTNAPAEHAERVLKFYGVRDLFSSITDIRDAGLKGKPFSCAFEIALKRCGGTVDDSIFIDDQMKYVLGYKILGGTAIHVGRQVTEEQMKAYPQFLFEDKRTGGRIFHLNSIYEMPDFLKTL
ncbi:MAG: HAD hydrolase-like protein [Treponema sp.]|nr:HAD hydrolase-like protein [Spirochaetia bacterium]MDD7450335.1 HAD hydrolase-like protein [Treponema sp.]MDY2923607.1 HAD hydrolase-like protein [Treponema sp.]MDY5682383.1 HAD hydrolase-like protein [Treponema sp.]